MAATPIVQCNDCGEDVLRVKLNVFPFFKICVNPISDQTGHVVETGNGTARVLKLDRSDLIGGEVVYKAHHLTCNYS